MTFERLCIRDISLSALEQVVTQKCSAPAFRFRQVRDWFYKKDVIDFAEMNNVPANIRAALAERFAPVSLTQKYLLESVRGDAVKFGFETYDSNIIESVILIDDARRTLCVSSQVGCALGCVFCETGKLGFTRNLTQAEILDQIILANRYLVSRNDKRITNLVFMGMGEALFNFENFYSAVKIISDEDGLGIGGRKITVSTAGVIPSIKKLQESDLNVKLAISLNSHNNETRSRVMPINNKYPIEDLIKAANEFAQVKGSTVTFEYVVLHGETDTPEAVASLATLLRNVNCKLNLIPVNPYTDATLSPPDEAGLNKFGRALADKGLTVTVRKSRGQDISGACGQLAGKQ